MTPLSVLADHVTTIGIDTAETHASKPALAPLVHQAGRPAGLTAEIQPMQSRTAACFEIRLIPHHGRITEAAVKRKHISQHPPPRRIRRTTEISRGAGRRTTF
jgi:hypothetical protein